MHRYQFVSSPFGNFAVSIGHPHPDTELETYYLTPIGELAELPIHENGEWLDQDAREAEAVRQLEARGNGRHPMFTPRPEYTVNRAVYTGDLNITLAKRHYDPEPYTRVSADGLTDSARAKLAAWWDSVRDSVITEEFQVRSAIVRHSGDMRWSKQHVESAQKALSEAVSAFEADQEAHAAAVAKYREITG